jgi:hypothetical protein
MFLGPYSHLHLRLIGRTPTVFLQTFRFLAYFPYFEWMKEGLWDHLAVYVFPLPSIFECPNQSLWNFVYHGTWAHLNGVLHTSLSPVCVYVYTAIIAKQRLGRHVPVAANTRNNRRIVGVVVFCTVRVVSKKGRRFVLKNWYSGGWSVIGSTRQCGH